MGAKDLISDSHLAFLNQENNTALELAEQAIKLEPRNPDGYRCAANACMSLGRYDEAIKNYSQAVKCDPANGNRYYDLGFAQATTEKSANAMKSFAQAEELGCAPENLAQLYNVLGIICFDIGRYDDALINLNKAEQLIGVDLDIMQRKAVIYGIKEDVRNGLHTANEIKLVAPSDYVGYKIAFKLLVQAKRLDAAAKELGMAGKYANPSMDYYFDCVTLELEKYHQDQDKVHFSAALEMIDKALKVLKPTAKDVMESYINAAEINLQLEKADKTIECLNAAQNPIGAFNNKFEVREVLFVPVELTEYDVEDMIEEDRVKIAEELGDYGLEELAESVEPDEDGNREYFTEILDESQETVPEYKLEETDIAYSADNIDQINRLYVGAYTLKKDFEKVIEYARKLQTSESIQHEDMEIPIMLYAPAQNCKINPAESQVNFGDKAVFEISEEEPAGMGQLSYQWYKDNVPLENQISAALNIDPVLISDAGSYSCKITSDLSDNVVELASVLSVLKATPKVSVSVGINDELQDTSDSLNLTATVAHSSNENVSKPTGEVEFFVDEASVGKATLVNGEATLSGVILTSDDKHSIYAKYIDTSDENYAEAVSTAITYGKITPKEGRDYSLSEPNGKNGWYKDEGSLVITPMGEFDQICEEKDGEWKTTLSQNDETSADGTDVTFYLRNVATGEESHAQTVNYKSDHTAPVNINVTAPDFSNYDGNEEKTYSIAFTAEDTLSGIAKIIWYDKSDNAYEVIPDSQDEFMDHLTAEQWQGITKVEAIDKAGNSGVDTSIENKSITVSITEANFYAEDIKVLVNNSEYQIDDWSNNGDEWTGKIKLTDDGAYVITVTYTDRSGNEMTAYQSEKIIIDRIKPAIEKYGFEPAANDGIAETSEFIETLEYGYYFKTDFALNIAAADSLSGMDKITYRLVPYQDGTMQEEVTGTLAITDDVAKIIVPAGFKGQIFVESYDNAGNKSDEVVPRAFVVDTSAPTVEVINNDKTTYKDAEGNSLYVADTSVTAIITDTVSGIKEIDYTQNSEKTVFDRKIILENTGYQVGDDLGDGWIVAATDANLVTKVAKTFSYNTDDNDIVLTVTAADRSGNETKGTASDKFTIDKTVPIINVVFREDDDTDTYYSQNRIAAKIEMSWKQIKYISHNNFIIFQIIPMFKQRDIILFPTAKMWGKVEKIFSLEERQEIIFLIERINWKRDIKVIELNIPVEANQNLILPDGVIENTKGYITLDKENLFDVNSPLDKEQAKEIYLALEKKYAENLSGVVSVPKDIVIKGSIMKEFCMPILIENKNVILKEI